jgi:S1-C subfamily serine protease
MEASWRIRPIKGNLMRSAIILLAMTSCGFAAARPLQSEEEKPRGTGELRRRAMFGAQLAEVTAEVRERQKLEAEGGVLLEKIFPDTSAAEAGFQAGDVVLAVNGDPLTGTPMFLDRIAKTRRAGRPQGDA